MWEEWWVKWDFDDKMFCLNLLFYHLTLIWPTILLLLVILVMFDIWSTQLGKSFISVVMIILYLYTKVYILPFIMVVKILKSDTSKWSYAHLIFEVLKVWNGEIGFQSSRFIIASIANWARNNQNYTIYASNFDLKLSQYI